MPDAFANRFDGTQNVKLLDGDDNLVAGGETDGFSDSGIGACGPFSDTVKSASRLISSGPMIRFRMEVAPSPPVTSAIGSQYRIRPENTPTPGRWNNNDGKWTGPTCDNPQPQLFWPQLETDFQAAGKSGVVVLSDAGYYHSPGEVGDIPAPDLSASTLSFRTDWDMNTGAHQPLFKELMAFVVAARAPARVNLNTATDVVREAAMMGIPPPLDTGAGGASLRPGMPYTSVEDIGQDDFSTTLYIEGNDNNGDNVKDDYNELEQWYKLCGNIFTLRSHRFSVVVAGEIWNSDTDIVARVLAKYRLSAVLDRGLEVDSSGRPRTQTISIRPGPSN